MNGNAIWVFIVLIIVIVGGWFLFRGTPAQAPTVTDQTASVVSTTTDAVATTTPIAPAVTVNYTDQGFSPKSVSISLGTVVTFVNQSSGNMWVASAVHPAHAAYSGTSLSQHCPDTTNISFDECTAVASGNSFSFTFTKAGTWKYHNHTKASDFGAVTVTAESASSTPAL